MDNRSMAMQIPAIFSVFGSFSVILTYAIFPDLRRLRYVELVFYVAVNDLLAAIGAALGDVPNGTFACWFQDVTTNANNMSSAFWTTVIAYQLWVVVLKGQTIKDMRLFHAVCWVLPFVLCFLPLSTNTFGKSDDEGSWCFIRNRPNSPSWSIVFWDMFSFYVWIWLAIFAMLGLLIAAAIRVRSVTRLSDLVVASLKKLSFYPIIYLVCWIPSFTSDMLIVSHTGNLNSKYLRIVGSIFPILQGFLLAVIFYAQNAIVRERWRTFLVKYFCSNRNTTEDSTVQVLKVENESDYIEDTSIRRSVNGPPSLASSPSSLENGRKGSTISEMNVLDSTMISRKTNSNVSEVSDSSDVGTVSASFSSQTEVGLAHDIPDKFSFQFSSSPKKSFLYNNKTLPSTPAPARPGSGGSHNGTPGTSSTLTSPSSSAETLLRTQINRSSNYFGNNNIVGNGSIEDTSQFGNSIHHHHHQHHHHNNANNTSASYLNSFNQQFSASTGAVGNGDSGFGNRPPDSNTVLNPINNSNTNKPRDQP